MNIQDDGTTTTLPKKDPITGQSINPLVSTIKSVCPNYPLKDVPQYGGPLTRFMGRFVDSNRTGALQAGHGMRTLRAHKVIVAPETNRVYMVIGSTFAQWDTVSFFNKIGNTPLVQNRYGPADPRATRPALGFPVEKHLDFEGYAYAEDDYDFSDWQWVITDGQERLFDIHYDDRGYVYLAYTVFGWGIVGPDMQVDAPAISQITASQGGPANNIFSFKVSGRYYVLVSDGQGSTRVYDTTNPADPVLLTSYPFGVQGMEPGVNPYAAVRNGDTDTVALINHNGQIRVFNGSSLINGGGPIDSFNPPNGKFYAGIGSDGSNFYTVESETLKIGVIRPNGARWTMANYDFGTFYPRTLRVGGGYISIAGYGNGSMVDVRLFKIVGGAPAQLTTSTDFFLRYYSGYRASGDPIQAKPFGFAVPPYDAVTAAFNGRTYLFYSGGSLGDVFEIEGTGTPPPPPTPTPTPTPTGSPTPTPTPTGSPTPTPTPPPTGCSIGMLDIQYDCANADCAAGTPVTFRPYDWQNNRRFSSTSGCTDTYVWNAGGSRVSNQKTPTFTFPSGGNYEVTLSVNGQQVSRPVSIGGGGGGNPTPTPTPSQSPTPTPTPPTNSCNAAPSENDLNAIYASLPGGSGCTTASGNCQPGEVIEFDLQKGFGSAYNLSTCHTVTWTFPGGATRTGKKVQQAINATGDQAVSATVSVAGQQRVFPLTVHLAGPPAEPVTGVTMTASQSTVAIDKTVTFTAAAQPDDTNVTFSWDFDGIASTIERTGKQVQFTWTTPGDRTVTVTAARGGSSAVASKQIKVTPKNTYAFLLPVVAHLPGQNGARWRTDLQIYNPDPAFVPSAPIILDVEFKGVTTQLTVDSSTKILEDFMSYVTQGDNSGSMLIRGNSPVVPQMWTRTYTVSPTGVGTYGQLIPAIRLDESSNVVAGASRYFVAGLETSPRFRTNLGLINPTPTRVDVEVTAFNETGIPYGAFTAAVEPFALFQVNDLHVRIPGLPTDGKKYSLRIANQAGTQLVAYQSTIDQISNDPIYIGALSDEEAIRTAMRVQWVPGVARLANGNWKTDFTIFNPDEQGMQVDVTYFNASGDQVSTVPNYTLAAKSFVSIADVLSSGVFNVPAGADSFGTIKVETRIFGGSQKFPLVYGRTYSDRLALGTFGQGIPGFSEANAKINSPAFIPGVRSNNAYRTNVGLLSLAATGETKVRVILLDKTTGVEIGSWSPTSLKPNQLIIAPDFIRNAIGSVTDQGSLKIVVDEGGPVWGFASIIDQMTSDAEYVPAIPLAPVTP